VLQPTDGGVLGVQQFVLGTPGRRERLSSSNASRSDPPTDASHGRENLCDSFRGLARTASCLAGNWRGISTGQGRVPAENESSFLTVTFVVSRGWISEMHSK